LGYKPNRNNLNKWKTKPHILELIENAPVKVPRMRAPKTSQDDRLLRQRSIIYMVRLGMINHQIRKALRIGGQVLQEDINGLGVTTRELKEIVHHLDDNVVVKADEKLLPCYVQQVLNYGTHNH
jgi:hypothetical protein